MSIEWNLFYAVSKLGVFVLGTPCIFKLFMLYVLIHAVLAVKFVVGLWNRVYYICTLFVLKDEGRG